MTSKITAFIVLMLILAASVKAQSSSGYAFQNNLKFDMKYRVLGNNFLIIDDVPNHKIGMATGVGSLIFKDGSGANVKVNFIYDYTEGNGEFDEYYTITFPDSSRLTLSAAGKTIGSSVNGSDPLFSEDITVTGGTGTYFGAKGDGSATGNRREALENDAIVKLSFDVTIR